MNKTLVLKVHACYHCDYSKQLINEANGEVLISGDQSHDKIDEKIDGFILGLEFSGIKVILLEEIETKCDMCKNLYNIEEEE